MLLTQYWLHQIETNEQTIFSSYSPVSNLLLFSVLIHKILLYAAVLVLWKTRKN